MDLISESPLHYSPKAWSSSGEGSADSVALELSPRFGADLLEDPMVMLNVVYGYSLA